MAACHAAFDEWSVEGKLYFIFPSLPLPFQNHGVPLVDQGVLSLPMPKNQRNSHAYTKIILIKPLSINLRNFAALVSEPEIGFVD